MKAKIRQQGVTLPEMLTAVAITVIMLGASGMIFKSAAKTSGKAMALNNLMSQVRVATTQIDKDFAGFRADLPWAVIFEGYNNGNGTFERRDRLVFFANGDFNNLTGNFQSDTARIFYGQSFDRYYNQDTDPMVSVSNDHDLFDKRAWDTNSKPFVPEFPYQRVLCRKQKMMSSVSGLLYSSWFEYDSLYSEYGPDSYWKNATATMFDIYMRENFDTSVGHLKCNYNYPIVTPHESFVRRPWFDAARSYIKNQGVDWLKYDQYRQQMSMLDDVTDFTVQIWWRPPNEAQARWYPNDNDMLYYVKSNISVAKIGAVNVFYNNGEFSNAYWAVGSGMNLAGASNSVIINSYTRPVLVYGDYNLLPLDYCNSFFGDSLPTAMKISFRLHDEGRSHYPDGKRFEYVVRLPESK